jgi:hypothetical protein
MQHPIFVYQSCSTDKRLPKQNNSYVHYGIPSVCRSNKVSPAAVPSIHPARETQVLPYRGWTIIKFIIGCLCTILTLATATAVRADAIHPTENDSGHAQVGEHFAT